MNQVLVHDFVDIRGVQVGIPSPFRIDDQYRAFLTSVQAPGRIDPDPVRAGHSSSMDPRLGMLASLICTVILATGAALALVGAEEHMAFIEAHVFRAAVDAAASSNISVVSKRKTGLRGRECAAIIQT